MSEREWLALSMTDKAGRLLLATQLRAVICCNTWVLAVLADAAKVLESDAHWMHEHGLDSDATD